MKRAYSLIAVFLWLFHSTAAWTTLVESEENVRSNRTARDISCKAGTYPHNGICCVKCPAGTYVQDHCTESLQDGTCKPCDYNSFTEHDHGLHQCLPCDKCSPDKVITKHCSPTSNTECQCRKGFFCLPHQACEVCKKCNKCKEDEFAKVQCTPTSNTICEKKTTTNITVVAVVVPLLLLIIILGGVAFYFRKPCLHYCRGLLSHKDTDHRDSAEHDPIPETKLMMEPVHHNPKQLVGLRSEDEDRGLGESLPNTARSSQASLSAASPSTQPPLPCSNSSSSNNCSSSESSTSSGISSHNNSSNGNCGGSSVYGNCSASFAPPQLLAQPLLWDSERRQDVPRLIPLRGDESLRKSLDLFEEVDVQFHKRFFRHIGLSDNDIKTVENHHSDDKIYALLRIWLERRGLKASINDLIDALLQLDQKLSAENIIARAVECGLYKYEDDC